MCVLRKNNGSWKVHPYIKRFHVSRLSLYLIRSVNGLFSVISRPSGFARGCSTNIVVNNWLRCYYLLKFVYTTWNMRLTMMSPISLMGFYQSISVRVSMITPHFGGSATNRATRSSFSHYPWFTGYILYIPSGRLPLGQKLHRHLFYWKENSKQ